jgi:imidazolonepropionase-like amidohydrolase
VLEVPGGAILPGLVDAHVHLCADGTDGILERIGEPSADGMMAVIVESLRRHLAAGVTTVRDLGDRRFAVLDWRSSARGGGVYPAVVAAGPPITSVGGHCASMVAKPPAPVSCGPRCASAPTAASTSSRS